MYGWQLSGERNRVLGWPTNSCGRQDIGRKRFITKMIKRDPIDRTHTNTLSFERIKERNKVSALSDKYKTVVYWKMTNCKRRCQLIIVIDVIIIAQTKATFGPN